MQIGITSEFKEVFFKESQEPWCKDFVGIATMTENSILH